MDCPSREVVLGVDGRAVNRLPPLSYEGLLVAHLHVDRNHCNFPFNLIHLYNKR